MIGNCVGALAAMNEMSLAGAGMLQNKSAGHECRAAKYRASTQHTWILTRHALPTPMQATAEIVSADRPRFEVQRAIKARGCGVGLLRLLAGARRVGCIESQYASHLAT